MSVEDARVHLAWLMWCFNEGYVKAEDREGMHNWMADNPVTMMTPEDAETRHHLLEMADEVLARYREARQR